MGSPIDSSRPAIRDSTNGGASFRPSRLNEALEGTLTGRYIVPAFKRPEGCYREDIIELWPAVADEHGNSYQVLVAEDCLQRAPAPAVRHEASVPNAIDAFYAAEFERLELALEANFKRPQAVPSSISGGSVATLGVAAMTSGGEAVFGSILEEHEVTNPAK